MTITAKQFLAVKDGNPPEHNDDAAAADPIRRRFAISDGAAESGFSRIWSRLLVEQFVEHAEGSPDAWDVWLPAAQSLWLEELKEVEIPWYGETQFEQGAFATFLGVVFDEPHVREEANESEMHYRAVAVGDSCMFHTRAGELLRSFPLKRSEEFGNTPRLVGSRSRVAEIAQDRAATAEGVCQKGDRLLLASDALALWCLFENESQRRPWKELADISSASAQEHFAAWIGELRATRGLRNDDVTLVAIEIS